MSADNYNLVRKLQIPKELLDDSIQKGDWWEVFLNFSASCTREQNLKDAKPVAIFKDKVAAISWANDQGYTEYGTEVDDGTGDEPGTRREMRVRVDGGKYTFIKENLEIKILRHDEPWVNLGQGGFNALVSIMCELDAARVVLQLARELARHGSAFVPRNMIADAIRKHDGLVSDTEPPSEWSK